MIIFKMVLSWLTGGGIAAIGRELRQAHKDKLDAANEEQRVIADLRIEELKADLQRANNAADIRKQTAGFWEMRLITFLIAGCMTFHLVLVTLDTCFRFGWGIPAFPKPFDEWQGVILLSFFGVQVAERGILSIAAAIRGRR